jgi:hypothetical protein
LPEINPAQSKSARQYQLAGRFVFHAEIRGSLARAFRSSPTVA